MILLEIQSRHSKAIEHRTYVKFKPNKHSVDGIEGWYCTCKDGARTVGCCSHVASLILYFSVYKDSEFLPKKTDFCSLVFTYGVLECSEDELFTDTNIKKKKTPFISKSQPSKRKNLKQKKKALSQPTRGKNINNTNDSMELDMSLDDSIYDDSENGLLPSAYEPCKLIK